MREFQMKKQTIFLLKVIFLVTVQNFSLSAEVKNIKNGIELSSANMNIKVQFYDDNIVRILKWNEEGTPDKLSLSVIKNSIPEIGIKINENNDTIFLSSSDLTLKISKSDGNIGYYH